MYSFVARFFGHMAQFFHQRTHALGELQVFGHGGSGSGGWWMVRWWVGRVVNGEVVGGEVVVDEW